PASALGPPLRFRPLAPSGLCPPTARGYTLAQTMSQFGQNLGYVDELYRRYRHHPQSVARAWRGFFGGDRPASASAEPAPATPAAPLETPEGAEPLRGAAARLAENMTA